MNLKDIIKKPKYKPKKVMTARVEWEDYLWLKSKNISLKEIVRVAIKELKQKYGGT
jgi:hypothetical protein